MFDLNEEIAGWRNELGESDAISPTELDELESHLRDSFGELQVQLDRPEEAFWLATRRLGSGEQLDREFSKINPNTVWARRAKWMLAGYLIFSFLTVLSGIVNESFAQLAVYFSLPLWQSVLLCSAGTTLSLLLVIVWTWRTSNGRSSGLQLVADRFGQLSKSGSQAYLVAFVLIAFAIPTCLQMAIALGSSRFLSVSQFGLSTMIHAITQFPSRASFLATLVVSVCWLANQDSTKQKHNESKIILVLLLFVLAVSALHLVTSLSFSGLYGMPYPNG